MKNTNTPSYKNTKIKLAIVITTLTTALVSSMSHSAIVQAAELVKIKPIEQISLYQEAKQSLALSFTGLTINTNDNDETLKNMIAKNNSTNTNVPVTLVKANAVSE